MKVTTVSTTHAKLNTVPVVNGQIIFTSDEPADLYWDLGGKRFHIGSQIDGSAIVSGKIDMDRLPIVISSADPPANGTPNTLYLKVEG